MQPLKRVIYLGGGQDPDVIGNVTEESKELVVVETVAGQFKYTPAGLQQLASDGVVRLIRGE